MNRKQSKTPYNQEANMDKTPKENFEAPWGISHMAGEGQSVSYNKVGSTGQKLQQEEG